MSTTHCVDLNLVISSKEKRVQENALKILRLKWADFTVDEGISCTLITRTIIDGLASDGLSLEKLNQYTETLKEAGEIIKTLTGVPYSIYISLNSY